RGFLAAPPGADYPAQLSELFRQGSSIGAVGRGARRFARRRMSHGPRRACDEAGLEASLSRSLPATLAVGRGTALFVEGRCSSAAGVSSLQVTVDGHRHPVMGHGVAGPAGSRDRWWAIVPFTEVERAR